jgi:hypothetical protein
MDLQEFLDNFKSHTDILQNYVKSQKDFIEEEKNRFNQLAWEYVDKELASAKKQAEGYKPNSEQLKRIEEIKNLLDQNKPDQYTTKEEILANILRDSPLISELEFLENGYWETEIAAQSYNNYYEYSENNFTAMFELYTSRATLMLVYSIFEFYLKALYDILPKNELKKLGRRPNVAQMKEALEKNCGIEKSILDSSYWHFLDTIRSLRNLIIHNNGIIKSKEVDEFNRKTATVADKINLLKDDNGDTHIIIIELSEAFFGMTIENMLKFFEEIVKSKQ